MGSAGSLPGTPSCGQVVPANKTVPSSVAAGSPAGTYVAEQTSSWLSPAQYTLVSNVGGSSKKGDARGVSSRRRHNLQDGSCTELAALRSLEPLLSKTGDADNAVKFDEEAELLALLEGGSVEVSGITRATPSPNRELADQPDVYKRLYPTKRQLGSCETPDKSNDAEFFDWLCRPPPGMFPPSEASTATGGVSRSLMDSSMRSEHTSHTRSMKVHGTHYDLFASLPGSLCPSEIRRRRPASPVGRPPSPGGRGKRTLEDRIQPIVAISKSAVEVMKANEMANGAPPHLSILAPLQGTRTGSVRGIPFGKADDKTTLKGAARKVLQTVAYEKRKTFNLADTVEQLVRPKEEESAKAATAAEGSGADGSRDGANISRAQREAAEALRTLLLGSTAPKEAKGGSSTSLGSTGARSNAAERSALSSPRGTKREVIRLATAWARVDADHSGRVNTLEFREFAKRESLDEKLVGTALGRKNSFTLEDLLRIMWPCAAHGDVKAMASWVADFKKGEIRAKTPQPLTKEEYEVLTETFRGLDSDGSGCVEIAELVKTGVLDQETASRFLAEFDDDGSGQLNEAEFCEMMCDSGRRINESATLACDTVGNRIVLEEGIGWLRKDLWEDFEQSDSKKALAIS